MCMVSSARRKILIAGFRRALAVLCVLDHPACRVASANGAFLLAVDPNREDECGDPDGHDEYVDQDGESAADTDGPEERPHVCDEDDAADCGSEDAGRQDAYDVSGYRGGDDATEQQGPDDRPRDFGEAKG